MSVPELEMLARIVGPRPSAADRAWQLACNVAPVVVGAALAFLLGR